MTPMPPMTPDGMGEDTTRSGIAASGSSSVYELFRSRALAQPHSVAMLVGEQSLDYAELLNRVDRLAGVLNAEGVGYGDRIAMFSENRMEYIELHLAAARMGAIVACQNWRLTAEEIRHCVNLVEPRILVYSPRYAQLVKELALSQLPNLQLGDDYEARLETTFVVTGASDVHWESGLLILYTSGTTGPAKAALISQRALVARQTVLSLDLRIDREDGFLAWSPMFHIGGSEHSLSTLMMGGTVYITDGFEPDRMADIIARYKLGWLLLVPAMTDRLKAAMIASGSVVRGIKAVGSMPDLVPTTTIAELSTLFDAPFFNTFGATETGLPPASGDLIGIGVTPQRLSKTLSSMCALRIVGSDGKEVAPGAVGEAHVRGPTVFSGYWGAPEVNKEVFSDGWFNMGDLFRRNEDGSFDFVGRSKYLIKSGGENIYPAEIENLLLSDAAIADAVVVRKKSDRWGEVPVVFVARVGDQLQEEDVRALCEKGLASYKMPREIHFLAFEDIPRNSNGKIVREKLEQWLTHPKEAPASGSGG